VQRPNRTGGESPARARVYSVGGHVIILIKEGYACFVTGRVRRIKLTRPLDFATNEIRQADFPGHFSPKAEIITLCMPT
jgi:hypothetical protein